MGEGITARPGCEWPCCSRSRPASAGAVCKMAPPNLPALPQRRKMKITAIETINLEEFPNVLWVHLHTDEGIIGLGETFYAVEPVIAHIHQTLAPYLLGKDPLTIDKHSRWFLNTYLGFKSVGVEMRAASAVDIALWDILGQVTKQPIYQLLGGASREQVRAYNTCAGYQYVRAKP